ncbi:MAG TPA: TonB-dependent receptor plug domain-containing protein [Opitutaceae bacterium]|nr:TonB-dependent receptor plug domain-containing protein [Opitutaceae bacterium]
MKSTLVRLPTCLVSLGLATSGVVFAQPPPAATPVPAQPPASRDAVVELSAFEVSTALDRGYRAGNSVSATRIDTPIKDLPFAVSAFTQQFIQDTGSTELFDLVRYAPGVTSGGKEFTGGKSVFTIRGFDQQPQRNGFVGNTYVDTVAIERVEVVKGPASVLYGQVAPGGTVNYITKRAQAARFTQLNVTLGSYNLLRTQIDTNQPIVDDKVLARFNGVWQNGMQYIDPTGKASDQMWVIAPTITWKITPKVTLVSDYE